MRHAGTAELTPGIYPCQDENGVIFEELCDPQIAAKRTSKSM